MDSIRQNGAIIPTSQNTVQTTNLTPISQATSARAELIELTEEMFLDAQELEMNINELEVNFKKAMAVFEQIKATNKD